MTYMLFGSRLNVMTVTIPPTVYLEIDLRFGGLVERLREAQREYAKIISCQKRLKLQFSKGKASVATGMTQRKSGIFL